MITPPPGGNRLRPAAERVDGALRAAARALAVLGAAATAGIFALVLAAVAMRYGVSAPFRFTEEAAGLLLAMTVFCALPFTLADDRSIRVGVVADRARGPLRRTAWIAGQMVATAFFAVFAWHSWAMLDLTQKLRLATEVSRLPLTPFVAAMTASAAIAGAICAWQALRPPPAPPRPDAPR